MHRNATMLRLATVLLLGLAWPTATLAQVNDVEEALPEAISRALPVLSASPGLVFEPAPDGETLETTLSGQLFLEIPQTLGAGRRNATIAFSYIPLARSDGDSDFQKGFDEAYTTYLSASMGVHERIDLNVALPLTYQNFDSRSDAHDELVADPFLIRSKFLLSNPRAYSPLSVALGLGASLRTKQRAYRLDEPDRVVLSPAVFLSGRRFGRVRPYFNGAVDITAFDVDQTEIRWGVGADASAHERVTVGTAVVGRHELTSFEGDALAFNKFGDLVFGPTHRRRRDFYDLSIGLRAIAWKPHRVNPVPALLVLVNVLVPLNDDGIRADAIPTVGLEYVF